MTYARRLFVAGAMWNFLVGGMALVFPERTVHQLYGVTPGSLSPLTWLAFQDFAAMVVLFGIGYLMVGLNPAMNHGIVLLGILGKVGIAVALPYRYLTGQATAWILIPAAIDLVFALLYLRFLLQSRRG